MAETDTIAAIATAPGQGGIGIVRLSGPAAADIAGAITGQALAPRHAHYRSFRDGDGQVIDSGICLFFPGPQSFTGEDVVELQGHGGPVILDLLVREACRLGARPARPGEFSQRAFLNDKIDLAQAEAIADLIASQTERAARNATRSMQGAFSRRIDTLMEALVRLRVYVEAAIDFPEEEIDFLADGHVSQQLDALVERFEDVHQEARQGSLAREGMKLVITGRPNAGKSSLLNALAGKDIAIVTPIEGTTRDVLREHIQVEGMPLHIVDTAGLRSGADEIEQEGIRRAWREMSSADRILLVVDATDDDADCDPDHLWPERLDHLQDDIPVTIVLNKCDLTDLEPGVTETDRASVVRLSARTGEGLDLLRHHLATCMGFNPDPEGGFSARRRHLDALDRARSCLEQGRLQLKQTGAGELLAEDLRQCQAALGEITGDFTSDDLLGEIFSSFCIGK